MTTHSSEIEPAAQGGDPLPDPGLPPHTPRLTDTDTKAAKRAERQIGVMFGIAALGSIGFVAAYLALPLNGELGRLQLSNILLGLGLGASLLLLGLGAVQWAKKLMPDVEIVQERSAEASTQEARDELLTEFQRGTDESGIKRRPFILGSMITALGLAGLPAIVLLRDLGPLPGDAMSTTMWTSGTHILIAETYQKIRPEDLEVGTLVSAVPEGIEEVMEEAGNLNELAKSAVMLIRMDPSEIVADQTPPGEESWTYEGIMCYSKICTHVGCPLGLYEQLTHHMLCPCHQSTFNLSDAGNVIFGPAARALPQLAITVDEDGYLVAREGFAEPVGPSFWERG